MSFARHSASSSWLLAPSKPETRLAAPLLTLLRALRAVLRSALLPVRDARRIQRSTHHVIAHAGQVLHAAAADEHNRVLLQVVADAWNVRRHFDPVRQPHARNLAQRRVRLFRSLSVNARTHSPLLGTGLQRRTRCFVARPLAA